MKLLYIISIIYVFLASQTSFARKPAVMDFVGIEHESFKYQRIPSGADVTYNFEKKDYSKYQQTISAPGTNSFSLSTILSLMALVFLPFAVWTVIKIKSENKSVDLKVASLEIMEKYKKAKEQAKATSKDDNDIDDISKAS